MKDDVVFIVIAAVLALQLVSGDTFRVKQHCKFGATIVSSTCKAGKRSGEGGGMALVADAHFPRAAPKKGVLAGAGDLSLRRPPNAPKAVALNASTAKKAGAQSFSTVTRTRPPSIARNTRTAPRSDSSTSKVAKTTGRGAPETSGVPSSIPTFPPITVNSIYDLVASQQDTTFFLKFETYRISLNQWLPEYDKENEMKIIPYYMSGFVNSEGAELDFKDSGFFDRYLRFTLYTDVKRVELEYLHIRQFGKRYEFQTKGLGADIVRRLQMLCIEEGSSSAPWGIFLKDKTDPNWKIEWRNKRGFTYYEGLKFKYDKPSDALKDNAEMHWLPQFGI